MSLIKGFKAKSCGQTRSLVPRLESLEDRQLLSTCHVTRLTDQGIGKGFRGDLRYCINKVNAEPGPDDINLEVQGTINLAGALPSLGSDMNIRGPGSALLAVRRDTGGNYRIFEVKAAAKVEISGLTVSDGNLIASYNKLGGGIYNAGNLRIINCVITKNRVDVVNGRGGGVYNLGRLEILGSLVTSNAVDGLSDGGGIASEKGLVFIADSVVSGNTADQSCGGIYIEMGVLKVQASAVVGNHAGSTYPGGGLCTAEKTTITHSIIARNTARNGAAIYGVAQIAFSYIGKNIATGDGGGIYGGGSIQSSTIADNVAKRGGGLFGAGLTVINSTLYGNQATAGAGGGIYAGGSLTVKHTTISTNSATTSGGGIHYDGWKSFQVRNSIVAGNLAGFYPDIKGFINSSGFNLIGNLSGSGGFASTDLLELDPLLGPLTENGGPTQTMALLPGSPAIDAGDNNDAPEFDQRGLGFPRIVNGTIDIGAFEVQASPMPASDIGWSVLLTANLLTANPLAGCCKTVR